MSEHSVRLSTTVQTSGNCSLLFRRISMSDSRDISPVRSPNRWGASRRDSIMTARTGMTGFTAFSSNSTTQQKFLQILNECKLLAADKRKLESETVDQKATLDQLRAKVWALEQKIKELTVQNDVFLRKNAGANIEGDTLEFYKSEYIKALADAKRLEISQKGHVERTVELQKQVDHSNQTIAEIRTKLESLETIRLETVEELNVIDYLYQKISEFLKNVAISTQIAALRQRGKYSDDRVLEWMNEKLDPQLEQLQQPGAVASLMKLIVDNLAPLIRPSAMDLDTATVKVFNAAAGWYETSDIAHVSRLIAQIEEGMRLANQFIRRLIWIWQSRCLRPHSPGTRWDLSRRI